MSVSFPPSIIGLLVFGGSDEATGVVLDDSFSAAFSVDQNLLAWRKVGAAPLTRACLQSPAVLSNCEEDLKCKLMEATEAANHLSAAILSAKGFDSIHLKINWKR